MKKQITGPLSWYINKNPQEFFPDKAKKGDKFFVDGIPLKKLIFEGLNQDGTFNAAYPNSTIRVSFSTTFKHFVADNPEHLNLFDASGCPVDNKAMRIALPPSIAQELGVKFHDKIKITLSKYHLNVIPQIMRTVTCAFTDSQHDHLCRCGHHKDDHTYFQTSKEGECARWICRWCKCVEYEQRIGDLTKFAFNAIVEIKVGILYGTIEKA